MKTNRLSVQIIKSLPDLYSFTVNPANTPKWIDSILVSQTSEWPIKIGTTYRNQDKAGAWAEYEVFALEENKLFELISKEGNFHVRYTYTSISDAKSELEYFEWVDEGDIPSPMTQDALNKLKYVLEVNT